MCLDPRGGTIERAAVGRPDLGLRRMRMAIVRVGGLDARIAEGADDILATRDVVAAWKRGVRVERRPARGAEP